MFNIVLYQPEIPPNTGNILRLAANSGSRLHLIKPLGFRIDAPALRRAGLDYDALADVSVHECWEDYLGTMAGGRIFALSTRGGARHDEPRYAAGDAFLFGPETRGLPEDMLMTMTPDHRIRLPMMPGNRSLNLSNAVAVVIYEAWRQHRFAGSF